MEYIDVTIDTCIYIDVQVLLRICILTCFASSSSNFRASPAADRQWLRSQARPTRPDPPNSFEPRRSRSYSQRCPGADVGGVSPVPAQMWER